MIYSSPPRPGESLIPSGIKLIQHHLPIIFFAQAHPWFFSFSPTPHMFWPHSPLPQHPTSSLSSNFQPYWPPCYSLTMPDAPVLGPLQWLFHLPEHCSPDAPMTNSFTSCKPFHKGHALSGADLCPPPDKFFALLPCSLSFFPVHLSPSTSCDIGLFYYIYYLTVLHLLFIILLSYYIHCLLPALPVTM